MTLIYERYIKLDSPDILRRFVKFVIRSRPVTFYASNKSDGFIRS